MGLGQKMNAILDRASFFFFFFFRNSRSFIYFLDYLCLIVLSIIMSGLLKCPTVTVKLSISPFNSVSFCFMYFDGH